MGTKASAPRVLKFAHAYWKCGNETKAARDAGYQGDGEALKRQATRLLTRPDVKAELERLREASAHESVVDRAEALDRWSEMLRFDIGPYIKRIQETMTVDGTEVERERLVLDIERMAAEGKGHLVAGVEFTDKGGIKIKFPDRQKALMELARLEGWYSSEKHEHHHTVADLSKMSDAELTAKSKELGIEPEG